MLRQILKDRFSSMIMASQGKERKGINILTKAGTETYFSNILFILWRKFVQEYPKNTEGELNFISAILYLKISQ